MKCTFYTFDISSTELKRKASRRKHSHHPQDHHQVHHDMSGQGGGYVIEEDIYQPSQPRKQPGKRGRKSNAEKQRLAEEEAARGGVSPTDSPPKKKFMR